MATLGFWRMNAVNRVFSRVFFGLGLACFICYLSLYMVYYGLVTWRFWHTAEAKTFVYRDGGWREQ